MAGSQEADGDANAHAEAANPPSGTPLCTSGTAAGPGAGKDTPTLVTVAGAVASGLGVLGFVTFAGGVVLWTRFKGMGLPADHALGLVPKSELVATGAEFLAPAVLLSLLIVVIAVLISNAVGELAMRASRRWLWLVTHKWLHEPRRVIAPLIVALGGLAFSIAALMSTLPLGAFAVLVGVSILGALVMRACGRLPFVAVSLVAFLAIGTFVIARTYERTSHRLEVMPMAYSRSQPGVALRVEIGYFVVETSDRILFASEPEGVSGANELREFPRTQTDDLEVGGLALPEQAEEHAARFAYNLCERLAHLTPSSTAIPTTPVSTVTPKHESLRARDALEASKRSRHKKPAPPTVTTPASVCTPEYVRELANKAGRPWLPAATECRTHLCVFGKLS